MRLLMRTLKGRITYTICDGCGKHFESAHEKPLFSVISEESWPNLHFCSYECFKRFAIREFGIMGVRGNEEADEWWL